MYTSEKESSDLGCTLRSPRVLLAVASTELAVSATLVSELMLDAPLVVVIGQTGHQVPARAMSNAQRHTLEG